MKQFKNPLIKLEHNNVHMETMTLVMDSNKKTWFHHEDCCKDFIPLSEVKFILTEEEKTVIAAFIKMAESVAEAHVHFYGK